MTLHLPDGRSVPRPGADEAGTWIDVRFLEGLGVEVKDLGNGTIGLCPSPERCIPVSEDARRGGTVDLTALAQALGVVIADDGHHAVIRHGPAGLQSAGRARLGVGDQLDLTLSDLNGHDRPIIPRHGRVALFAWASW